MEDTAATPPATLATPASTTATGQLKRKRTAESPDQIINDLESRDTSSLCPDLSEEKGKLIKRAKLALDDSSIDQTALADCWRALSLAIDSQVKVKELLVEQAQLKERVQQSSRTIRDANFLMRIGDWIHSIHDILKRVENKADLQAELAAQWIKDGIPPKIAHEDSRKYKEFKAFSGVQMRDSVPFIDDEIDAIRLWREQDEVIGLAPQTPYLDRIGLLCETLEIPRAFYLRILRVADQRNEAAHDPPPFRKNIQPDGTVDWSSVWSEAKDAKIKARKDYFRGKLSISERDLMTQTIETWLKVHVQGWSPSGTPIHHDRVEEGIQVAIQRHIANQKKASEPAPPSFYRQGKWDDIA